MTAPLDTSAIRVWIDGPEPDRKKREWRGYPLIAHALGRIGGQNYTNSAEALARAYERGLRMFEADVVLTSDGEPVLQHGWTPGDLARLGHPVADGEEPKPLSAREFLESRIDGQYTTQHLTDLCRFLRDHADVRVLFDIRQQTAEQTRRIYARIAELLPEADVRARCMAGCYTLEMVDAVAAAGDFGLINLFYDEGQYESPVQFATLCRERGVHSATVGAATVDAAVGPLRDAGIAVLQFTLNRGADVVAALAKGVDAVGVDETAPEQVKRAGEVYLTTLAPYRDDRGNVIVYDGERPPKDVNIRIRGRNNVVRVNAGARLKRLDIILDNDNARVTVGSTRSGIPMLGLRVRAGQDCRVSVGDDVTSTGSVYLTATEGATVKVGNDVMFATGNEARADDAHAIYDVASGRRVNRPRSIVIGDHVWLGRDAVVLGGGRIGDGSVVGYRSLVTSRLPNNCIAVGTPARVTRRNIAWERAHLDDFPPYKNHASVVETSEYWNLTEEDSAPTAEARLGGTTPAVTRRTASPVRRAVRSLRRLLSRAWRRPGR